MSTTLQADNAGGPGGTGFIIDTPAGIDMYRLLTLKAGLKLELKGMRMSKGRTAYAILKSHYGYMGTRGNVLACVTRDVERILNGQ